MFGGLGQEAAAGIYLLAIPPPVPPLFETATITEIGRMPPTSGSNYSSSCNLMLKLGTKQYRIIFYNNARITTTIQTSPSATKQNTRGISIVIYALRFLEQNGHALHTPNPALCVYFLPSSHPAIQPSSRLSLSPSKYWPAL